MSDAATPSPIKTARRFAAPRQKVPAFARFEGTSAWKKDRRRARDYNRFRAATKQASDTPHP